MQGLTGFTLSYFVRKHCSPSWRLEDRIFPMYDVVLILEGSARY
jgi:hypothetical protein